MSEPVLKVEGLTKIYTGKKGSSVVAAKNVNFTLNGGEIIGLVGESGSGKTTIGRLVTGIETPTAGSIEFYDKRGQLIRTGKQAKHDLRRVQMVFQDPYAALNPFNTVEYSLIRPLINFRKLSVKDAKAHAFELLQTVQLTPPAEFLIKRPDQLSGGQRQRVVVARALAASPDIIVADEPTSMLDVSIRADILQLLDELRTRQNVSFLYITHDLISTQMLADRLIVLYRGRVVETGASREIVQKPQHPYTQLLLRSIPNPWVERSDEEQSLLVDASTVTESGCVFQARCPFANEKCGRATPKLSPLEGSHEVACFLHGDAVEEESVALAK